MIEIFLPMFIGFLRKNQSTVMFGNFLSSYGTLIFLLRKYLLQSFIS